MSMIRFERVVKALGGRRVLQGVNLTIEPNETFVILGGSGGGKSVTLKHMVRLLTPDEGRVWIGDDCVSEATGGPLERIRNRFGMLFQSSALLQWMSVGDNVALPLREKTNMGEAEIQALVEEKLDLFGMRDAIDKFPADLSGGMQRRVGLARAVITAPEIILYDEPTSGLDPMTSRSIDALINDLRTRLGVTSVVVTHDLHSALSIATRIGVIAEGRIDRVMTPDAFVRSDDPVIRKFLEAQYITKRGRWEEAMAS